MRAAPRCPPGLAGLSGCLPGAGRQDRVDGVADLALERAQGFFRGFTLGQLLVVIGAAVAVPAADLGDCGHVDRVVGPPAAAPGQPAGLPLPRGDLDGGGAVAGGDVSRLGNRDTSRTSPMTAAAITGPAPKMPVRLVPAPRTAASILLRVWRIWASMPRRPAACSAASSQRAAATAPAGVTDSRIRPACPAVICFQAPPGISPQHGMQPAGHLGAGAAQVLTPPGP